MKQRLLSARNRAQEVLPLRPIIVAWIFVGLLNIIFIERGTWLWQFNFFCLLAMIGSVGYGLGQRRVLLIQKRVTSEITANLPTEAEFHYDEDTERRTAFVTKGNGEIVSIDIPPEISSAEEALVYITEQVLPKLSDENA